MFIVYSQYETVSPSEDPIIKEVSYVLREWSAIWRTLYHVSYFVMIQSFRTNRSMQTVQTQIRLLLEELSDLGLHCLLFRFHLFDEIP